MKLPKWCNTISLVPLSPRNLRISAIMISIYQVLLAHVFLFITLLGLTHTEEMARMLGADIADQEELQTYMDMPTNAKGETLNQIRFKSACELASVTLLMLYIGTAVASMFLISCLSLLIGTLRGRSEFMIPWLVLDMVGAIFLVGIIFGAHDKIVQFTGGLTQYWILCGILIILDVITWFTMHAFYSSLKQMNKLNEVATIPIPCPGPNSAGQPPYYYRKENMFLGDGGYKHLLSDAGDTNHIV